MKKFFLGLLIIMALIGGIYQLNNVLFSDQQPVPHKEEKNEVEIGIRKGNIAADFTLPNLQNKSESLWDYRGKKIILNFWSSDCPPCREEMPDLNEYYLQNKNNNVVILAVNLGQSLEKVNNFIDENNYQFPVLVDANNSVAYAYGIVYLPTTYFINEEGVIEEIHIGMLGKEDLDKYYE